MHLRGVPTTPKVRQPPTGGFHSLPLRLPRGELWMLDDRSERSRPLIRKTAGWATLEVLRDERVWLPHAPTTQDQVNCFGYYYAGFPRTIEAVFGDGTLELAWILTAAASACARTSRRSSSCPSAWLRSIPSRWPTS